MLRQVVLTYFWLLFEQTHFWEFRGSNVGVINSMFCNFTKISFKTYRGISAYFSFVCCLTNLLMHQFMNSRTKYIKKQAPKCQKSTVPQRASYYLPTSQNQLARFRNYSAAIPKKKLQVNSKGVRFLFKIAGLTLFWNVVNW